MATPFHERGSDESAGPADIPPDLGAVAVRAYKAVFSELEHMGLVFATKVLGDAAPAQDVVQEALFALWDGYHGKGRIPDGSVQALFMRIVQRKLGDHCRKEQRFRARKQNRDYESEILERGERQYDIERLAEETLLRDFVHDVLTDCPRHVREMTELVYLYGFGQADAAKQLNLPYGSARRHLEKGWGLVSEALERKGYHVGGERAPSSSEEGSQ